MEQIEEVIDVADVPGGGCLVALVDVQGDDSAGVNVDDPTTPAGAVGADDRVSEFPGAICVVDQAEVFAEIQQRLWC